MSVKYLKYNGQDLPVKLGYFTLKMMQEEHGVAIENLGEDLSLYEPLLFYALQQGHKVTGKELKYSIDDMVDILDDCFFDFVNMIPYFFPEGLEKSQEVGGKTKRKK